MKVAVVNQPWNWFPPLQGGSIAIWIYEVARRLACSCDVVVYARKGQSQKSSEFLEGFQCRRVPVRTDDLVVQLLERSSRFYERGRPFFTSRLYYLGYMLRVAKDLRRQRCDIVHLQNFPQFARIVRALNPDTKVVLHMHCEWLTQLDREMIVEQLRGVHLVVGCSEYITQKVRRAFPEFAPRCQTVFNGTNIPARSGEKVPSTNGKGGSKRLLFVGRITPEKALHLLLISFAEVLRQQPQVELEIVGQEAVTTFEFIVGLADPALLAELAPFYRGSYLAYLQAQVRSLGLTGHVMFAGFVPPTDLNGHYRKADVLVNPSLSESFGMSLVEAMVNEVPVVATRVGGMTEIVEDGKSGLLVEPGNPSALAQAILRLLTDDGLRKSMGEAARRRAMELFSWEKIAGDLLDHYRQMGQTGAPSAMRPATTNPFEARTY
jgi:glycosyltransferase involved in cell wall biosynthesis